MKIMMSEYVWNHLDHIDIVGGIYMSYLIRQKVGKERGLVLFIITLPFIFIPKGWKAIF